MFCGRPSKNGGVSRQTSSWQRLKALTTRAVGAAAAMRSAAAGPPAVSSRKPGPTGLGQSINTPQSTEQHKFQFRDYFTWSMGRHEFKVGASFINEPTLDITFSTGQQPLYVHLADSRTSASSDISYNGSIGGADGKAIKSTAVPAGSTASDGRRRARRTGRFRGCLGTAAICFGGSSRTGPAGDFNTVSSGCRVASFRVKRQYKPAAIKTRHAAIAPQDASATRAFPRRCAIEWHSLNTADFTSAGAFMLARCAGKDKYFPLVETLFQQQPKWADPNVKNPAELLFAIARQAGFTKESFESCLRDQKMLDGIEAVRDRGAKTLGVQSTPTFFINGKQYRGALSIEDLEKAIEPLLKS